MKLLVGTSKGLVIYQRGTDDWELLEIQFSGLPVSMLYVDERTDTWWIGLSHRHWGQKLHYSLDQGENWYSVAPPTYSGYEYRPNKKVPLKKIWVMAHGGNDKPNELWLGTEPGGLFHSKDNGQSFTLVESLWNHPSRLDDMQWFGAGKDYPFIHSIVVDPKDSNHLYIGVSCAGVFETKDGGETWRPRNNGLVAAYLPNPNAEVGHDPHLLLMSKEDSQVIWQQNHCGIFRTEDGGAHWQDVSGVSGFPYYGFALAIGDGTDTAWVIPVESDEKRVPKGLKLIVCQTKDAGKSWNVHTEGLPDDPYLGIVLRHSLVIKENILAFGTNNGNVYISENKGTNWKSITNHLTGVNCLILN